MGKDFNGSILGTKNTLAPRTQTKRLTRIKVKKTNKGFCTICNKDYGRRTALERHRSWLHGKVSSLEVIECYHCNEWFPGFEDLKEHMTYHRENGELLYCTFCGFKCASKKGDSWSRGGYFGQAGMLKHIEEEHNEFPCPETNCAQICRNRRAYKDHRRCHREREQGVFPCDCGFISKSLSLLQLHKRKLHDPKSVECPVCLKMFTPESFREHRKTHKEKKISCNECGKLFKNKRQVFEHDKRVHKDERKYPCSFEGCSKRFFVALEVANHERVHTGEKPFQCETCSRTFRKQTQLFRHSKVHSGERPHMCDQCGKGFIQKSNMITHKLSCNITETSNGNVAIT